MKLEKRKHEILVITRALFPREKEINEKAAFQ